MANGTIAASQIEMLSLSGTGIITITPPATNTNRAITLPDAAGAIVVSGTTPALNGIQFPATQVASADANTLDDYEEGTWTPAYIFGSGSATYTTQSGTYTRIGRLVTVQIRIVVNVASSPGSSLEISGLPFQVSATIKGSTSAPLFEGWSATFTGTLVGRASQSSTNIRLFEAAAGTLSNPAVKIASGCDTQLTVTYEV